MPEYIERYAHESDAQYQLRCLRIDHEKLAAALEHERRLSRRLATKGSVMATAIQRVRDLHSPFHRDNGRSKTSSLYREFKSCAVCEEDSRPTDWPCATITALDGEVPDGA